MIEKVGIDWETKMNESQEKHKHKLCTGGIKDVTWSKAKYCEECDQFYYPEDKK